MSDDARVLYKGLDGACSVLDETFAEHVHRCGCEFSADQYGELMDLADARERGEKDGAWLDGARPEEVGDRIANAAADAYQALNRLRRLVKDAQRHDERDFRSIAEVAFRAAALDSFMLDPDRFPLDAAQVQHELWALLAHVGNISDYERVRPLRSVPAGPAASPAFRGGEPA